MRNEHILDILDEKAFVDLSRTDLSRIESHAGICPDCARAFDAARISAFLLKAEPLEDFAPSPFFQTRVLASLRQRQEKINPFAALARLWKASATLVVMMMAVVIGLIALTAFAPRINGTASAVNNNLILDGFSTDIVIMNERLPVKEPTNEQIFQIVYGTSDGTPKR